MTITAEQRKERQQSIGSSDVAALFGCHPWMTLEELYWSKVGELPDESSSDSMDIGNWLERSLVDWAASLWPAADIVERGLCIKRGVLASNLDGVISRIVRGSLDGEVARTAFPSFRAMVRRECVIEAKYVGPRYADDWGAEGTDQVPDYVRLQVETQMLCTGAPTAWIPVAIWTPGGLDRRMYVVNGDADIQDAIRRAAEKFWNEHVVPKIPPSNWTSPPTSLARLKVRERGAIVAYHETRPLAAFLIARRERERWEGIEQKVKDSLVELMGDAEGIAFPTGGKFMFKGYERTDIDREKLKTKFFEAWTKCQKTTQVKPVFTYMKGKNDDRAIAELGEGIDESKLIEACRFAAGENQGSTQ